MDYLEEARLSVKQALGASDQESAYADGTVAIACALVAQTELLTALIERLGALTEFDFDGGKALYIALTK